jgi:predicted esterase
VRYLFASVALCVGLQAWAEPQGEAFEKAASLAELFPADAAKALSEILPADQRVRWKLHVPDQTGASGLLIFVMPDGSAEPQRGWVEILDRRNLIWIAAEDFGNVKPTAQRILVALMALNLAQRNYSIDSKRVYIAGMSGGGRVASKAITQFPQLFTGAIYIVGVDFWTPVEQPQLQHIAANRYVFVTGDGDFNRRETRRIYKKYIKAGIEQALLIDLRHFGHEYPNAEQLERALAFLDTRAQLMK